MSESDGWLRVGPGGVFDLPVMLVRGLAAGGGLDGVFPVDGGADLTCPRCMIRLRMSEMDGWLGGLADVVLALAVTLARGLAAGGGLDGVVRVDGGVARTCPCFIIRWRMSEIDVRLEGFAGGMLALAVTLVRGLAASGGLDGVVRVDGGVARTCPRCMIRSRMSEMDSWLGGLAGGVLALAVTLVRELAVGGGLDAVLRVDGGAVLTRP